LFAPVHVDVFDAAGGSLRMIPSMMVIAAPRLRRLLRDWEDRLRGREFPARADFTPFDLKYILGNLSLIDVTHEPLNFRYRIHASNLAQRMNKDMTKQSIDDIPVTDHAMRVRKHFSEVVRRRAPVVYKRGGPDSDFPNDRLPSDCEVLVLPLSSDGKTIDMLMSALVWDVEE